MKSRSAIATFLIVMLTISQAIAAACSATCIGVDSQFVFQATAEQQHDMNDCHHSETDQEQYNTTNANCSMAGCHFAQSITFDSNVHKHVFNAAAAKYPQFVSTSVSADLPPPIKPPA